jgi:hypothetical protein
VEASAIEVKIEISLVKKVFIDIENGSLVDIERLSH